MGPAGQIGTGDTTGGCGGTLIEASAVWTPLESAQVGGEVGIGVSAEPPESSVASVDLGSFTDGVRIDRPGVELYFLDLASLQHDFKRSRGDCCDILMSASMPFTFCW